MELTRETFGNISSPAKIVFYLVSAIAMGIFVFGLYRQARLWRIGRRSAGMPNLKRAVSGFVWEVLGQRRVLGHGLASVGHILLFWGFNILLVGTLLLMLEHIVAQISWSLHFHYGIYYAVFEVVLDTAGLVLMVGCMLMAYRRWNRPDSLGHAWTDWAILGGLLLTAITGFAVEGLRVSWDNPPLPGLSFVGFAVAWCLQGVASEEAVRTAHHLLWWIHGILALTIVAALPYSRLFHSIVGASNLMLKPAETGTMVPVSLEELEETGRVGVGALEDCSQRRLMQLDACMECGRCQEACPAFASQKPLSPRGVVQDLKGLLKTAGPVLVASHQGSGDGEDGAQPEVPELHDATIQAEALWACTTCSACTDVCPVRIDPAGLILDMRRFLVAEGRLRGTPATSLRRMENLGNPWGLPAEERMDWAEGLGVPTVKDRPDFEILYWVGCAAAYDRRTRRVARSMIRLLEAAGVHYAILGDEERCTGESARRIGDEFLFQELAQSNIETLNKYGVKKILTHCPHCLNSLKRDYRQFGGDFEVVHHSEYLAELLAQGRLPIADPSAGDEDGGGSKRVTFHDPCYLARIHGVSGPPRSVLARALSDSESLVEMDRRRENTFCCGAGGGRMWFDEEPSQRVANIRAKEALATGADTVGVCCPFCLTMLSDALAQENPDARVLDVAELLAEKLLEPEVGDESHRARPEDNRKDQKP
jgi:Fe-S oxidoreductase/nitrate reductase gamma subunit